jgi:hypothetical protein
MLLWRGRLTGRWFGTSTTTCRAGPNSLEMLLLRLTGDEARSKCATAALSKLLQPLWLPCLEGEIFQMVVCRRAQTNSHACSASEYLPCLCRRQIRVTRHCSALFAPKSFRRQCWDMSVSRTYTSGPRDPTASQASFSRSCTMCISPAARLFNFSGTSVVHETLVQHCSQESHRRTVSLT